MDNETAKRLNDLLNDYRDRHDYNTAIELALALEACGYRFGSQEAPKAPEVKPAPPAVKFLKTKYAGQCCRCTKAHEAEAWVFWTAGQGSWCPDCSTTQERKAAGTYWENYRKRTSVKPVSGYVDDTDDIAF